MMAAAGPAAFEDDDDIDVDDDLEVDVDEVDANDELQASGGRAHDERRLTRTEEEVRIGERAVEPARFGSVSMSRQNAVART